MKPLAPPNTVRFVRKICGLSQAELATIIDCARLSIHVLEAGKLKLSEKMANKIALHTGVSKAWLLANDIKTPPVCARDSGRPYTKEDFEMTRAEIQRLRTDPVDPFVISNYVENFCSRLRGGAREAYRTDTLTYLYYKAREFFEDVEDHWNLSGQTGLTADEFLERLEEDRAKKVKKNIKKILTIEAHK
jgi:DNA-binding XRE family transcriptional regulator